MIDTFIAFLSIRCTAYIWHEDKIGMAKSDKVIGIFSLSFKFKNSYLPAKKQKATHTTHFEKDVQ
jgi:hypothetical protein